MKRLLFGLLLVTGFAGLRFLRSRSAPPRRPAPSPEKNVSYDDIALRAYFIGLEHDAHGEKSDPLRDWLQAEQDLLA